MAGKQAINRVRIRAVVNIKHMSMEISKICMVMCTQKKIKAVLLLQEAYNVFITLVSGSDSQPLTMSPLTDTFTSARSRFKVEKIMEM